MKTTIYLKQISTLNNNEKEEQNRRKTKEKTIFNACNFICVINWKEKNKKKKTTAS
jgi:hypothetical protein